MHVCIRLLAHITGARRAQSRSLNRRLRLRRRQPQRRVGFTAALLTQPGTLERLSILLLLEPAFGAPKRLRHAPQILAVRLGDEPCERQQFATLILRQARQHAAIRLDGFQHAQTGAQHASIDTG